MLAAGEPVRCSPGLPDTKQRNLRIALIAEELQELKDTSNLEEIADAIGDLLYVVLGTAAAYGLDSQGIFDEIHRSNMTKFIDGYQRADGKYCKGPSWTPPDLKRFILQQIEPTNIQ